MVRLSLYYRILTYLVRRNKDLLAECGDFSAIAATSEDSSGRVDTGWRIFAVDDKLVARAAVQTLHLVLLKCKMAIYKHQCCDVC